MLKYRNTKNNHIYSIVELTKSEDKSDYLLVDLTNQKFTCLQAQCYVYDQPADSLKAAKELIDIFAETADYNEQLIPISEK